MMNLSLLEEHRLLYENVSEEDVWTYWRSLFPEVTEDEKLERILSVSDPFKKGSLSDFFFKNNVTSQVRTKAGDKEDRNDIISNTWDEIIEKEHLYNAFRYILSTRRSEINNLFDRIVESELFENNRDAFVKCMQDLCGRLNEVSFRTLVTEIASERRTGRLKGDTSEDRYRFYTDERWKDPQYVEGFYKEYRELGELQNTVILNYIACYFEMIDRLVRDCDEIRNEFCGNGEGFSITSINLGQGDSHKQGRTVGVITFSSGQRLVYKPRSLKVEAGFTSILGKINKNLLKDDRKVYELKICDHGDYGYAEYVTQEEIVEPNGAASYYYQCGVLLAVLYAVNAKDIHHENIIAHGSSPVVIDLEALFHSRLRHEGALAEKTAYECAVEKIEDSVYSIGLLPMTLTNPYDSSSDAVDISGFGGTEDQISPFEVLKVVGRETDEIRLEKGTYVIEPQKNVPKYRGKAVRAEEYRSSIMEGFELTYRYLMEHTEEMIADVSKWFSETRSRVIYRPTYLYTKLMFTGDHPDFMRDRVHRYVLFHRMAYNVKDVELDIVRSEIRDMMQGDVPFFEIGIQDGTFYDSYNKEMTVKFKETPLQIVIKKLNAFSESDLQFQMAVIANSFLTKQVDEFRDVWTTGTTWTDKEIPVSYIKTAECLGEMVLEGAVKGTRKGKPDLSWINFAPIGEDAITYEFSPVEGDVYGGNAGMALFFLYLFKATGRAKFRDAAYASLNVILERTQNVKEDSSYLIGPFNGLSGYLYVISKFYLETGDESFAELINTGLDTLRSIYDRDTNYDIISGSAGAIKVCISLYNKFEGEINNKADILIDLLTEKLITDRRHPLKGASAWLSGMGDHVYAGYAHGTAGIAEALLSVYQLRPTDKLRAVIDEAYHYLSMLYVPDKQNWVTIAGRSETSNAWCHGAPGILYSICRRAQIIGLDSEEQNIFVNSFEKLKQNALGNNICYCHGDVGNLELIECMAEILDDQDLVHRCNCTYEHVSNEFIRYAKERPLLPYGLMLGLSGMGYSLLRWGMKNVPSVLLLE